MSRAFLIRLLLSALLLTAPGCAQIEKITIPAGTPEDKALQAIANEPDAQKKLSMYEDFVSDFSSNPTAAAICKSRQCFTRSSASKWALSASVCARWVSPSLRAERAPSV